MQGGPPDVFRFLAMKLFQEVQKCWDFEIWDGGSILKLTIRLRLKMSEL